MITPLELCQYIIGCLIILALIPIGTRLSREWMDSYNQFRWYERRKRMSDRLRNHDEILAAVRALTTALGKYGALPDFTPEEWQEIEAASLMLERLVEEGNSFHEGEQS